jgi:hypothetical protein
MNQEERIKGWVAITLDAEKNAEKPFNGDSIVRYLERNYYPPQKIEAGGKVMDRSIKINYKDAATGDTQIQHLAFSENHIELDIKRIQVANHYRVTMLLKQNQKEAGSYHHHPPIKNNPDKKMYMQIRKIGRAIDEKIEIQSEREYEMYVKGLNAKNETVAIYLKNEDVNPKKYCTIKPEIRKAGDTVQCVNSRGETVHLAGAAKFEYKRNPNGNMPEVMEVKVHDEWMITRTDNFVFLDTKEIKFDTQD